jgi:enterochelin esterase-like enzyme
MQRRHTILLAGLLLFCGACAKRPFMPQAHFLFSAFDEANVRACPLPATDSLAPCRVPLAVPAERLPQIAAAGVPHASGDTITFAARAPGASYVKVVGGVRMQLERVADSELWAASIMVPHLNEAVISYRYLTDSTTSVPRRRDVRGEAAPGPKGRAVKLQGTLRVDTLDGGSLIGRREIISYLSSRTGSTGPLNVIYMPDGVMVRELASIVDTLVTAGLIDPVALIGVRAAPGSERGSEYVYGLDPDTSRFIAHEHFFINDVSAWAQRTLGVTGSRAGSTLWGASNGGAFVVAMGLRHPERFDFVVAASPVYAVLPVASSSARLPQFHLLAGTFETVTRAQTQRLSEALRAAGARSSYDEFTGGHDDLIWGESFISGLER